MRLSYAWHELYLRRRRNVTAILSLSVGIALFVVINSLAAAYREAARVPLKEIGADMGIQRSGDVPQELQGAVFPCSAVTIRRQEVDRIRQLPGIRGLSQAVLLWVFDQDQFAVVLGVDVQNPLGPGSLRNSVTKGRFLDQEGPQALLEEAYAQEKHLGLGDLVAVAGKRYPVVGVVDASRAAKIAVANVYLPLAEAQGLALASPQVQGVSPFAAGDVNVLFVTAEQGLIPDLAASIKNIMGGKATVATPESFLRRLGTVFSLSDRFALTTSWIAVAVAILIVLKTMAGNVQERAREIGVLKCLGWTNRNVAVQFLAESLAQCLLAGVVGLLVAWLACLGLGFQEVNIPIPWEMSPTPHFLPGGGEPVFKTVRLPMHLSWRLSAFALALSLFIGGATGGLLSRRIARIKPSEVLRHE